MQGVEEIASGGQGRQSASHIRQSGQVGQVGEVVVDLLLQAQHLGQLLFVFLQRHKELADDVQDVQLKGTALD